MQKEIYGRARNRRNRSGKSSEVAERMDRIETVVKRWRRNVSRKRESNGISP